MENDVLDSLEDLGYNGNLLDEQALRTALEVGPSSIEFTQLTSWLTEQLKNLCGLEENVNSITSPEDANNFIMELSGFLRELNCPHRHLFEGGPVTERLHTRQNKLQLLDYLTSELQAVKILADRKPMSLQSPDKDSSDSPSKNESDVAKHLKIMLIALGFPKPPGDITPFQLFSKVENKVKQLITQYPNQIGKSLLKARLSDKQWQQVLKINDALLREYSTRREMILKRLDVTIQSFMWSEVAKKKQNDIAVVYQPVRKLLTAKCSLGVAQILAARDDLTKLQKTSSGDVREKTKCAINRVRIPKVPDRGGRAWELEPPPPEMPSFQKRVDQPQGQRPQSARGGGRGGGGRGGKVQGSWSDGGQQSFGGNWNQGGGGYGGGGGQGRDHYSKGGGYSQGGGGYNQGGGGYNQGGGGYNQGGGGYNQGGGGYNQGGGGYNQGGYNQGDYNQGGYQQDGGRGGKRGRGGRGRGGGRGGNR